MTDEEQRQIELTEEEPQVYTVKKDVNGWRFDRRTFLAVAGAAGVAAAVGTAAGCGPSQESVQESTAIADETVTATPSPTPLPSDTPASTSTPTPTETPDVTIPDGTVMNPGQPFTKTWRFRNEGTVPWGEGVKLVFVEGEQEGFESKKMSGPDAVDVPNVAPGKNVDVSVDLVAPQELGRHLSYWRLQMGSRPENILYAEIFVAGVGEVPPGELGSTIRGSAGEIRWLPCGDPMPPGWICTCNCVRAPVRREVSVRRSNRAVDEVVLSPCSCDSVAICNCDAVHYWHPC